MCCFCQIKPAKTTWTKTVWSLAREWKMLEGFLKLLTCCIWYWCICYWWICYRWNFLFIFFIRWKWIKKKRIKEIIWRVRQNLPCLSGANWLKLWEGESNHDVLPIPLGFCTRDILNSTIFFTFFENDLPFLFHQNFKISWEVAKLFYSRCHHWKIWQAVV